MKKFIFTILVIFSCVILFSNNFYSKSINEELKKGLNGYDIEETFFNKEMNRKIQSYQNENMFFDEEYLVLCTNVQRFNEYVEQVKQFDSYLENETFTVLENLEGYPIGYEDLSGLYNYKGSEKDSRIIEKNNQYLVKYSDINFDENGKDIFNYGKFTKWVLKKDINKVAKSEFQDKNYVEYIDTIKKDGYRKYVFFNNFTGEPLVVSVKSICGYVLDCKVGVR